jgi:hypothetical protein
MPTSVRVAVVVMAVIAALMISNALLLWYSYDEAVARIADESELTRDEASRFVLLSLVPNLVIGFLLALSAVFLPRRQPWARWTGLATGGLLILLTALQVVTAGGLTVASLLLLVLTVALVTSLAARTTSGYVPPLRARA